MTTQIVPPDAKRDAAAAVLAATAQTWPKVTLKQAYGAFPAGTVLRRAPSCSGNGTHYLVNAVVCECADYQRAGNVCKHVRAIRLAETLTDVSHDDLVDGHELDVEIAFADLTSCRRCGDRVRTPGWCQPCRHTLLGYDDLD